MAPGRRTTNNKALSKRKRSSVPAFTVTKKMKTRLQSSIDSTTVLGVVDPESGINGEIDILDNDPCDCMLVQVDPSKNLDRFYVLQFIESNDKNTSEPFVVYSRWGCTGCTGQGLTQEFSDCDEAIECFEKKFKEKTGLDWEDRNRKPVRGKYRVIKQNYAEKRDGYNSAKWQYWVDDGIDGKPNGWYDYDESGSRNVEQLYQENLHNSYLTNRLVESGNWTYSVDLKAMTQTNIEHPDRKSRFIRRNTTGNYAGKYYIMSKSHGNYLRFWPRKHNKVDMTNTNKSLWEEIELIHREGGKYVIRSDYFQNICLSASPGSSNNPVTVFKKKFSANEEFEIVERSSTNSVSFKHVNTGRYLRSSRKGDYVKVCWTKKMIAGTEFVLEVMRS